MEPRVFVPTSSRTPNATDADLAAAKVGYVAANDRAALSTAALAVGMVGLGRDYFVGVDGSWVRMEADGRVNRGLCEVQWNGIPGRAPAGAPAPYSETARYAYSARYMRTTALGNLPILSGYSRQQIHATLLGRGFVESGRIYTHQDGSRVDMRSSPPVLSYNNYALNQLETWWCRSGSSS